MLERVNWCQFCHHQTQSGDVEPLHQLQSILPDYEHWVCSYEVPEEGGFKASIKLSISSDEEVQKWLEAFQDTSKTTWKVLKTYPANAKTLRHNKYRVDLGCLHKARNPLSKKNTSCPAVLYLVLKKESFSQKRKSRSSDPHIQNKLTFHINIRNTHNHEINSSEFLKYRSVSKETIMKLEKLFKIGHSPASALRALKCELQQELGESYEFASSDRSICPDLPFCYSLYYKIFKRKCRQKDPSEVTSSGQGLQNDASATNQQQLSSVENSSAQERNDTEIQLRNMFDDLLEKMKSNDTFHEPIKSMVSSYKKMSTDTQIISALNGFGKAHHTISAANKLKIRTRKRPRACRTTPLGERPTKGDLSEDGYGVENAPAKILPCNLDSAVCVWVPSNTVNYQLLPLVNSVESNLVTNTF